MTEQEWLECTDAEELLPLLRDQISDRKLRLFALACCSRVRHLLVDRRSGLLLDLCRRVADGGVEQYEWARARQSAATLHTRSARSNRRRYRGVGEQPQADRELEAATSAASAVEYALHQSADVAMRFSASYVREAIWAAQFLVGARADAARHDEEARLRRRFLDCLVGPWAYWIGPGHPTWISATVLAVAQGIYDQSAFERLPILADALEDAGCTNEEILNHCRQPGEHVRGCWCVDLLLGKS